tara:strand:+ start:603 stop:1307 length:705 start_codon:yes stop_codon:yes gene_type:complete
MREYIMFKIPSKVQSASTKSPMQLREALDSVKAIVVGFEDSKSPIRVDGVIKGERDKALLHLKFPSLDTKFNETTFTLRFMNKTVERVSMEFYLYGLTGSNEPKATTSIGKWILGRNLEGTENIPTASPVHDDDGHPIYASLSEFAKKFKLHVSSSKLYSILRENESQFDLSNFAESIKGQALVVKTYYHEDLKDYTISTTDYTYKSKSGNTTSNTPQAKSFSVKSQAGNGASW